MTSEGVVFSDGHKVQVTPYQFIVGRKEYMLEGITKVRMDITKGNKVLPLIFIFLGLAGILLGWVQLNPDAATIDANTWLRSQIAEFGGVVLCAIGIIWFAIAHDRYSLRITTAEGEKEAIVSTRKEYVDRIFYALREAAEYRF